MHGDLRHEEHIVVTRQDYDSYLRRYPIVATHLAAQLITKTALFVGYSLTDPDFLNIRKVVRSRLGRYERMAFIVAFDTPQGEIDQRLRDNLHVIRLDSSAGPSRDAVLADFFRDIQTRIDARKGAQLRRERPDIFEPIPEQQIDEVLTDRASSPVLASSSNLCFVALPPGPRTDVVYAQLIRPVVEELGLTALRIDELSPGLLLPEEVRVGIQQARVFLADISYLNANVMYELGLAQSLAKPIVLLTVDPRELPFDVSQYRLVVYTDTTIENSRGDRIAEIRRLIEFGSIEAAAAVLGMVLELLLTQLLLRQGKLRDVKLGRPLPGPGGLLRTAGEMGLVSHEEANALNAIVQLRNAAVHGRAVGNAAIVEEATERLESFADRHALFV
jgi:hypothetical protein